MNWGKGIAIVMISFIIFITVMIIGFMSHGVDLEDEDYYQKEIAYEDEIVRLNNANELNNKPQINVTETHLTVQFNNDEGYEDIQLLLKRPNDEKKDEHFEISNTKFFSIDKADLQKGMYNIELTYKSAGKEFLQKENVYFK